MYPAANYRKNRINHTALETFSRFSQGLDLFPSPLQLFSHVLSCLPKNVLSKKIAETVLRDI